MLPAFFLGMYEFLSAPSARRATARRSSRPQSTRYFYPRPPRGGRLPLDAATEYNALFLSTPSARRATGHRHRAACHGRHFYPRPPRGGRPPRIESMALLNLFLSTPSVRRATVSISSNLIALVISIHALREEGDPAWERQKQPRYLFLSTPSARRATLQAARRCLQTADFYPPRRGGGPLVYSPPPALGSLF